PLRADVVGKGVVVAVIANESRKRRVQFQVALEVILKQLVQKLRAPLLVGRTATGRVWRMRISVMRRITRWCAITLFSTGEQHANQRNDGEPEQCMHVRYRRGIVVRAK